MALREDLPDMRNMNIPKAPGSGGAQTGKNTETIESTKAKTAPDENLAHGANKNVLTRLITRGTTKMPEIDLEKQAEEKMAKREAERAATVKSAEQNPNTATGDPIKGASETHVDSNPITGLNVEREQGVTAGNSAAAKADAKIPIEHAGPGK